MSTKRTAKIWGLAAGLAWSAMLLPASAAVDPIPDWQTLVFPSAVPKVGHTETIPVGFEPGLIRNTYQTSFEDYWKEVSYYRYNPTTGENVRGFFNDSKTYGFIQVPWPLAVRGAYNKASTGAGGTFTDGARLYSQFVVLQPGYAADAADADGFWTPGESYQDIAGDGRTAGQYDPYRPYEDYWNNDNTQLLLQRRNAGGGATGSLTFPGGVDYANGAAYRAGNVMNNNAYSTTHGEMYADYNNSADIANWVVGYETDAQIWYNNGGVQATMLINELDLSPTDGATINEGDFAQTIAADPLMNVDVAPASFGRNGVLDYTSTMDGQPQIRQATYPATGTALHVYYDSWCRTNTTTLAAGYVYSIRDVWQGVGAPPAPTATVGYEIHTIVVNVYQARELYGVHKNDDQAPARDFGDRIGTAAAVLYPATRTTAQEDAWTAARAGEPFEDYISWGGQFRNDIAADATTGRVVQRGDRGAAITKANYDAYIRWNYPGAVAAQDALIARAGNNQYDGPEAWAGTGTKITLGPGTADATTPEPAVDNHWDGRVYPTWQAWWADAFATGGLPATPPAAWDTGNYVPTVVTPVDVNAAGWHPSNVWGYYANREWCDLPSSIYHIGGDVGIFVDGVGRGFPGMPAWAGPGDDPRINPAGYRGGDMAFGEVTSPWSDNIWGEDLWTTTMDGGMPQTADGKIVPAGPFAIQINGIHGTDAGNITALEAMTRRTTGTPGVDVHPADLRDVNLDGLVDCGVVRTGDAYYSSSPGAGPGKGGDSGGDGSGPYPFNRQRFVEDVIEAWDYSEDFNSFTNRVTGARTPLYAYPIYLPAVEGGLGWASLGGPAGANVDVLTLDSLLGYHFVFQVRPINSVGEQENQQFAGAGAFGMGILWHEQGHDIFGLPDLYDYDVWSTGGDIVNGPISGYDLMAGGAVHGVADMKLQAGWVVLSNMAAMVTANAGPITLPMYPVEKFPDQYFRLINPDVPGESIDIWYASGEAAAYGAPGTPPGGQGVYMCHNDLGGTNPNAIPRQQRVNNHYRWQMIQADGLSELEDGVNGGNAGDPFPGNTNKRTFTENTDPASRWWGGNFTGLRILDIQLPADNAGPALVTFQRVDDTLPYAYSIGGVDTDADGIADAWEYQYFGDLTTANGTTDFDKDGLPDVGEYLSHTDPKNAGSSADKTGDADGDGLNNYDEVTLYGTNPYSADTDDDGISDNYEMSQTIFDPLDASSPVVPRALLFNFDGTPSGMEVRGPAGDTRFNGGSLTLEAWVSPNSNTMVTGAVVLDRTWTVAGDTEQLVLGLTPDAKPYVRFTRTAPVAQQVGITNSVAIPMESALPTAQYVSNWSHLAVSYDETSRTMRLYVNGALAGSVYNSIGGAWTTSTQPTVRAGLQFFGLLDEIKVWNLARAPTLTGLAGTETGLVGYYKIDDGTSGAPGADTLYGTADDSYKVREYPTIGGQVEDFVYRSEWRSNWGHAADLVGRVSYYTNRFLNFQPLTVDSDMDGVPDTYENTFPATLNSLVYDSASDPDSDGWSTESEFLAAVNADGTLAATPSPASNATTPTPALSLIIQHTAGAAGSPIVVNVYTNALMDGIHQVAQFQIPQANVTGTYPLQTTLTIPTRGNIVNAPLWFAAFFDANNDGAYSEGEALGFGESDPLTPGPSAVGPVRITLMASAPAGFGRVVPPANAALTANPVYKVRATNPSGQLVTLNIPLHGRTVLWERDFVSVGYPNGLPDSYVHGTIQWFLYASSTATSPVANGSLNIGYGNVAPATPVTTAESADLWRYSRNTVGFTVSTNTVRYALEVRNLAETTVLYSENNLLPGAWSDGVIRVRPVMYAGSGVAGFGVAVLADGQYKWRVKATNAIGESAWSAYRTVTVNTTDGIGGPFSINGDLYYQGKAQNGVFVIEAYANHDFSGLPESRTVVQKVSSTNEAVVGKAAFSLKGLHGGTYYVRGFLDQNTNGVVNVAESRGIIRSGAAGIYADYYPEGIAVGPNAVGRVLMIQDRDTDSDMLPDAWEIYLNGTVATMGRGGLRGWTDTDGDGLNDYEEYLESAVDSNPLLSDTDGDGLSDGVEILIYGTDPKLSDTDGDGISDGAEVQNGSNPGSKDTDGDGVPDALEMSKHSGLNSADADGDGYSDLLEIAANTDPADKNSFPGSGDLVQIGKVDLLKTGQIQPQVKLAPGVAKLGVTIEVYMESADTMAGPWTEVPGSATSLVEGSLQSTSWGMAPQATSGSGKYYRLRWRLKL